MNIDSIPLEVLFIGTIIILLIAIELGYRAGNIHPLQLRKDKEKITSSNATALLGILGFILVFTFGIVYNRYDSKKELVREEANLIRTAWLRSDFLPEQQKAEVTRLFNRYVDIRIEATETFDLGKLLSALNELQLIQKQIWQAAVINAQKDIGSYVAALYVQSVNDMINVQALRVAVGVQSRIPTAMWILLYLLIVMGMFAIGYQASISGSSRKSWLTPIMVLSFSLVIMLIVSLDRPGSTIIRVSQQPIIDLKTYMETIK